jgi:hypothetical protein
MSIRCGCDDDPIDHEAQGSGYRWIYSWIYRVEALLAGLDAVMHVGYVRGHLETQERIGEAKMERAVAVMEIDAEIGPQVWSGMEVEVEAWLGTEMGMEMEMEEIWLIWPGIEEAAMEMEIWQGMEGDEAEAEAGGDGGHGDQGVASAATHPATRKGRKQKEED